MLVHYPRKTFLHPQKQWTDKRDIKNDCKPEITFFKTVGVAVEDAAAAAAILSEAEKNELGTVIEVS